MLSRYHKEKNVPLKPSFIRTKILKEKILYYFFSGCSSFSFIITTGIVLVLLYDSVKFFSSESIIDFFTGTVWSPNILPVKFGILPLISGTMVFTIITAVLALPAGLLTAIYLSEYAGKKTRTIIKPTLEVLAGMPTVVYGYFALIYITPWLKIFFPGIETFNALSASIVVAIMILPTIASISEDAMNAVPVSLREGAYALGGTKFQVCTGVVVPAALSGIISSFILGISRVIGETMAVTIAAGNLSRMVNPLDPGDALLRPLQTMTAAMVEIGMSDVTGDSDAYKSLYAVGLTLFMMTLILNWISQYIRKRFREVY